MQRPNRILPNSGRLSFYTLNSAPGTPELPLFLCTVEAGFPSPAGDYMEKFIDLNKELVRNPSATICVRVHGDSMRDALIFDGDVLIIDRARDASENDIAVCILDGDFTVKRLRFINKKIFLHPENKRYPVIEVGEGSNFEVWGVVSWIIHKAR